MATAINEHSYQSAIYNLNSLQSNFETLISLRTSRKRTEQNILDTLNYLHSLGISMDHIDRLNCIHVAGTKGKGSTSAFIESILRNMGYKTGFFSSPHLIHVRERIQLNGVPISEQLFTENFFHIYNSLKDSNDGMPAYFKFLTLMAFYTFLKEKVDVAIVEVGIGGEYDCTNVIRNPIVCGISTLDFDHTSILGSTIAQIAWHKAGIMKKNSILLTVPQLPEAMKTIRERSIEKECPFYVVPMISSYEWPVSKPTFGIPGQCQAMNVSLALQIVRVWLKRIDLLCRTLPSALPSNFINKQNPEQLSGFVVPSDTLTALENCKWPGRCQTVIKGRISFFLDGAHTQQSIKCCAEWFLQAAGDSRSNQVRILVFHCTGDRDAFNLLKILTICKFDMAFFCPTRLRMTSSKVDDSTNYNIDDKKEIERCDSHITIWNGLTSPSNSKTQSFPTIEHTLKNIDALSSNNPEIMQFQVLVTGSLHLVGGVLSFL